MTTLDTALSLRARGFSVIPLIDGDKRPAVPWLSYQSHHASVETLTSWFKRPRNIGIVTGAISGVVVVDVDSTEAYVWAERHLPYTPMRTKTAKGQHWFYRHPGTEIPNRARVGAMGLDVRGDGGYVVGPGSVHPSGVTYEAVGAWPSVDTLPLFDVAWLADASEREAPVYPVAQDTHAPRATQRKGRSHSGRNDLILL